LLPISSAGGGSFVVGQEQDLVGGGFSNSEAYVGQLTQLNVWDHELSFNEIEAMRISCKKYMGNVIAWADVLSGLKGNLQEFPSNFCSGK
jgi:hypothetical protein